MPDHTRLSHDHLRDNPMRMLKETSSMLTPESALASLWLIVLRLVEVHGIDARQFGQEVGVPPEALRDVNARLPSRLVDIAFAKAAARIPDPAFALRAGECWHPSNLGTMAYAWLSSRTLHTALTRLERFGCILSNRATYRCVDGPAGLHFVLNHGRNTDRATGPLLRRRHRQPLQGLPVAPTDVRAAVGARDGYGAGNPSAHPAAQTAGTRPDLPGPLR